MNREQNQNKQWRAFMDDERHQLQQSDEANCIHWNARIRLKSSCIPPINTGLHGGSIESLWDRNDWRRGLEILAGSSPGKHGNIAHTGWDWLLQFFGCCSFTQEDTQTSNALVGLNGAVLVPVVVLSRFLSVQVSRLTGWVIGGT